MKNIVIGYEGGKSWQKTIWGSKYMPVFVDGKKVCDFRFSDHDRNGEEYCFDHLEIGQETKHFIKIHKDLVYEKESYNILTKNMKYNFKTIKKIILENGYIIKDIINLAEILSS